MSDESDTSGPMVAERIEFEKPFYDLLELEAEENDETVEELLKRWAWVEYQRLVHNRWKWLTCEVEVDIPQELWERVELELAYYRQLEKDTSADEVLFNVVSWNPTWMVEGREIVPTEDDDE
ncbi:MAG: hypothetical protein ABEJ80_01880 [Halarchaeum sp.]